MAGVNSDGRDRGREEATVRTPDSPKGDTVVDTPRPRRPDEPSRTLKTPRPVDDRTLIVDSAPGGLEAATQPPTAVTLPRPHPQQRQHPAPSAPTRRIDRGQWIALALLALLCAATIAGAWVWGRYG